MTTKVNLSEAAKEVLAASVASKFASRTDGPAKLDGSVAYGTKEAGVIGKQPKETSEELPDYLKGTPRATPPGATPPVPKQPTGVGATRPTGQPQETAGRADLIARETSDGTSYDDVRDRIAGKLAPQAMEKNPNANFQSYDVTEEVDPNDVEDLESADGDEVDVDETDPVADAVASQEAQQARMEAMQISLRSKMKEDIAALVDGENLSEEFVTKATTIFEAAVIARADSIVAETEAELTSQFETALEQVKEDLAVKVDDYLSYMVEEWMKTNEIAVEKGLRAEIVEDFITELRGVFVKHYIDIPVEKVNVVEELSNQVIELEDKLNAEIENSVQLKKSLSEQIKKESIQNACEGLVQTQVEKFKSLAESIEFTTEAEFMSKLKVLKESYFKPDVKVADDNALNAEINIEDEVKKPTVGDSFLMERYAKAISKTQSKF